MANKKEKKQTFQQYQKFYHDSLFQVNYRIGCKGSIVAFLISILVLLVPGVASFYIHCWVPGGAQFLDKILHPAWARFICAGMMIYSGISGMLLCIRMWVCYWFHKKNKYEICDRTFQELPTIWRGIFRATEAIVGLGIAVAARIAVIVCRCHLSILAKFSAEVLLISVVLSTFLAVCAPFALTSLALFFINFNIPPKDALQPSVYLYMYICLLILYCSNYWYLQYRAKKSKEAVDFSKLIAQFRLACSCILLPLTLILKAFRLDADNQIFVDALFYATTALTLMGTIKSRVKDT